MKVTRRQFLIGCSAAIGAMAGGRLNGLAFAAQNETVTRDILVVLFLRGGCDGLSLLAPAGDPNYVAARNDDLRLGDGGFDPGLPLANPLAGLDFRLHPQAAPLRELYDSQQLAIVHACGLTNGTRSHFDAMDFMERGTPGDKTTPNGWLTRHLLLTNPTGLFPAVAAANSQPISMMGYPDGVAMYEPTSFSLQGHWKYGPMQQNLLRKFYTGNTPLHQAGLRTLNAMDTVDLHITRDSDGYPLPYQPENGVEYPSDYYLSGLDSSLKTVAQLIKMDVGLQVATIDYGGWDTHEEQAYIFPDQVNGLSRGIAAFYNDLSRYHGRLTMVVMSEFGRRLRENESRGTDHGHGNVMFVLGGNVNGGQMYGNWPGLATEQLDNGVDLAVTTDYRTVLSEIVVRRLANPQLSEVFPAFAGYQPLNLVRGSDLPIQ